MPHIASHIATLILALTAVSCGGCSWVYPGMRPAGPTPCVPAGTPRELAKVTMPDYIIEPPDILAIQALRLLPKQPYRLQAIDVVSIGASGLLASDPLGGDYSIQPDGTIHFGHNIGAMRAEGLTVAEFEAALLERLRQEYTDPRVWVTVATYADVQQISGEHLVAPDGTVNLGTYGRVRVVGLTVEEARRAIEAHLSQYLESARIVVDVLGYNSKVFYVVTQGAGLGDRVVILPVRGNETVLDAIGQVQGLTSTSSTRMWVARPGGNSCGGDQLLPVDWLAITQRGDVATNYQMLPGDRLFVSEDKLVAFDTALAKVFAPIERVLGVTALGAGTIRAVNNVGNSSNNSGF
ncbi:Polysaccharide biosynthesis/export protein [Pseudobythopirellula maris]|uniref:Polysaccharide biosynthesis/export protein n=1 Tax=Pseudobythopirellula maris TaxID=2527991 RepID=A0A5C5ZTB4_9BACT|nr:polysaccharide biosynthesis/export family protein [Pseudobythopirellula maris]TWT90742.1 Polysaccharide biosynthesis/export protein [Pseudobythopirellula maris]